MEKILLEEEKTETIMIGSFSYNDRDYAVITIDREQFLICDTILKNIAAHGKITLCTREDRTKFFINKLYPHLSSLNENEFTLDDSIITNNQITRINLLCIDMDNITRHTEDTLFSELWFRVFLLKEQFYLYKGMDDKQIKDFINAAKNMKVYKLRLKTSRLVDLTEG